MPKIVNATLRNEIASLAKRQNPENFVWSADHMAVAVMRTVLVEMGCKEVLTPEHVAARQEVVKAISQCFTAPVNYKREYLVAEGLAPKQAEKPKVQVLEAA